MELTQERLKELLSYNPETGEFVWKVKRNNRIPIGSIAGAPNNDGYVQIRIDRKLHSAHRLAFLYMTGEWPAKEHVDHIDRNPTNNKWSNLREATRSENFFNKLRQSNNRSGHKGVHWDKKKNKWWARITHEYTVFHLGFFDDLAEAAAAFEGAARLLRGEFHMEGQ